ncbi:PREDICTED: protein trichome birefringence-like 4 [Nelumbo nucifera]|uniref:Protein trichome birefringence-like 4 n=2 Tax=Nelumbo nucifera TaxID=4432 RepID=A0A1U8APD4_NELNU|nr:PREDICTED: protein trichome birefringence-like 4 [Nelumbo nucifera]DAD33163.1 TPA_asm: hypothetical protein HUJ06_012014 [Nelumbo nucifera]
MACFKILASILVEFSRNLRWPLSRSRTHICIGSLFGLALFFYLSATLADNSPAVTSATLASRLLFSSTSISSFSSFIPLDNHLVSDPLKNNSDGCAFSTVAAVERTRQESTNKTETHITGDLTSCDIFDGKWVFDNSDPIYQPGSCPFIDDAFNCFKNGRLDSGYMRYRWKPNDCQIPRLDGKEMLEILKGKRLAFVGDSLNRNMWQSLVCALRESVMNKSRVFEVSGRHEFRTQGFYSFIFTEYNCSIEFFRSPFLVQEWKINDSTGARKETLRLDLIHGSSSKYFNADIIIFNTGHWWTHQKTSRGKDYFQEGDHVHSKLGVAEAYTKALHTWARWVDGNIDSDRTRVFFRGYSASHFRGGQWSSGGNCENETQPITNSSYLAPYPQMMNILESVIREMRTPVFYLNVTRMTDYRKDGHPSIFRQPKGHRQAAGMIQDCSHWCLPGVPDVWNQLLYTALLISSRQ